MVLVGIFLWDLSIKTDIYSPVYIKSWKKIVELCVVDGTIFGLRYDGTVLKCGYNSNRYDVENWNDVEKIYVRDAYSYADEIIFG